MKCEWAWYEVFFLWLKLQYACGLWLRAEMKMKSSRNTEKLFVFHSSITLLYAICEWECNIDMAADSKRWPNWIRIKTDFHDNMQTCDLASVETWRDFCAIAEEKKKEQQQAKHDEEETSIKADEFCYFWCADDRFNLFLCRHLTHNYTTSQKQLTYDSRSALLNHECVLPKRQRENTTIAQLFIPLTSDRLIVIPQRRLHWWFRREKWRSHARILIWMLWIILFLYCTFFCFFIDLHLSSTVACKKQLFSDALMLTSSSQTTDNFDSGDYDKL